MLYHHYCYHRNCKLLLLLHQTDFSIIQIYLNPKDAQAHLLVSEKQITQWGILNKPHNQESNRDPKV